MNESKLKTLEELCKTIAEEGREHWWIKPEIHEIFERNGLSIDPDHFYSPTASRRDIEIYDFSQEAFPLNQIEFNFNHWSEFLVMLGSFGKEFMELNHPGFFQKPYPIENDFCSHCDALALYTAVRKFKPRRIVEIGSGFSTHVFLSGMRNNGVGTITCIEPYPTDILLRIQDEVEIRQEFVQNVEIDFFSSLDENDILFIDSSHVSAFQSDVNYEFFNILPTLKNGVVVHVHDIFLPYEYPSYWVKDLRWRWNEQYLLYAFLIQNSNWSVFMPTYWSWNSRLDEMMNLSGLNRDVLAGGVSFWMQRVG